MAILDVHGLYGPTIYAGNQVTTSLVELVKNTCTIIQTIRVSFDVIGRTKHETLGYQLARELGNAYLIDVGYNYKVVVTKEE